MGCKSIPVFPDWELQLVYTEPLFPDLFYAVEVVALVLFGAYHQNGVAAKRVVVDQQKDEVKLTFSDAQGEKISEYYFPVQSLLYVVRRAKLISSLDGDGQDLRQKILDELQR